MNLNPLKKDDTADALVKALEDANNTDAPVAGAATQVASVPSSPSSDFTVPSGVEESMIAADPQITGENPLLSDSQLTASDTPVLDNPTPVVADDSLSTDTAVSDDSSDEAVSQSPDMPAGLSNDADAHLSTPADSAPVADVAVEGELGEVKKDALEALRPLIEKLDLEPADKFEKYLMMLRASDDPKLIKPAYDAAVAIEGEKEKAQALLDIINEINYITANK